MPCPVSDTQSVVNKLRIYPDHCKTVLDNITSILQMLSIKALTVILAACMVAFSLDPVYSYPDMPPLPFFWYPSR